MELCSLVAVAAAGSMVRAAGCCALMAGASGWLVRPDGCCGHTAVAALETRPWRRGPDDSPCPGRWPWIGRRWGGEPARRDAAHVRRSVVAGGIRDEEPFSRSGGYRRAHQCSRRLMISTGRRLVVRCLCHAASFQCEQHRSAALKLKISRARSSAIESGSACLRSGMRGRRVGVPGD